MLLSIKAMFLHSLHETIDQRSLQLMLGVAFLLLLAIAGTSFDRVPFEQLMTEELPRFRLQVPGSGERTWDALEVGGVAAGESGTWTVEVRLAHPEEVREILAAIRLHDGLMRGESAEQLAATQPPPASGPLTDDEARSLVRRICDGRGYGYRDLRPAPAVGVRGYVLTLAPPYAERIVGGGRVSVLFGLTSFESSALGKRRSYVELLLWIQGMATGWIAGFLGMAVALIFTAGFFPRMLRPGAVDQLLSRPIHRVTVFWARYVGGLLYVFTIAVVLIGGTFLITGLRSGFWNWGALLTILSVTAMFGVLYAISVFWAVMTRSTVTSILMSLFSWFVFFLISLTRTLLVSLADVVGVDPAQQLDIPSWVTSAVELAYWVLPSPSDFDYVNVWCLAQAPISPELQERFLTTSGYYLATSHTSLAASIGSSVGFAFVLLWIACAAFCRRDY